MYETVKGKKERINAGKGRSMIEIVCWKAVVQTTQGGGRKERSEKVGMKRRHCITS